MGDQTKLGSWTVTLNIKITLVLMNWVRSSHLLSVVKQGS